MVSAFGGESEKKATLTKPRTQQAHALTPLLTEPDPPEFPFLTLLVSGGHTLLLLATSSSQFKIIADTVDNSIGYITLTCRLPANLESKCLFPFRLTIGYSETVTTRSLDC
jgi:hypothetical protein